MTKYDQQDHLEVLTELTVLYKLQNETQSKINIANERLAKIKKAIPVIDIKGNKRLRLPPSRILFEKYRQIKVPSSGVPPIVICNKNGIVIRTAPIQYERPANLFKDMGCIWFSFIIRECRD